MSCNPTPKEGGLLDKEGQKHEHIILGGSTSQYFYGGNIVKELGDMS